MQRASRIGPLLLTGLVAGLVARPPALAAIAAPLAYGLAKGLSTPELIDRARGGGEIDGETALLYLAYALAAPERLPGSYRSNLPWDGTLILLRVHEALPEMAPGFERAQIERILQGAGAIPASGPLQPGLGTCSFSLAPMPDTAETVHFYVEYNALAVNLGPDGLDIDDYLVSLEGAWAKEVDTFGWAAPPVYTPRPAPGGKYHVRIDALGPALYGFVSSGGTHAGSVGDNPNTAWNEGDASASCMALNQDYSFFPSPPQASLDSTTGHEFNHSIQFGYGALSGPNRPDAVFAEGGATWMEDEAYDTADDNYNYLWPRFHDSMGDYGGSPYAYWITFRGLTERYGAGIAGGGEQVMQDFWEETSRNTGNNLTAIGTALANRGTNLADAYHAYAVAVKFNRACAGGYVLPYCFEEGPRYEAAAGPTAVHAAISGVGGSVARSLEDNYALNWIALPGGGPYGVTLTNTSSGGQFRGSLVCDTGSGLSITALPAVVGAGASTTLAAFSPGSCLSVVAVITNQAQTAPNPSSSATRTYRLVTS